MKKVDICYKTVESLNLVSKNILVCITVSKVMCTLIECLIEAKTTCSSDSGNLKIYIIAPHYIL